ncbi:MAG: hypothetical protein JWR85_2029, partial [Marmoricola sp.]|nr:hypothetical protein [Marmoricola sp.]
DDRGKLSLVPVVDEDAADASESESDDDSE